MLDIIINKEVRYQNKSFRFKTADLERIKKIVQKTNKASDYTIFKETDIIKGLLILCEELSGKKLLT